MITPFRVLYSTEYSIQLFLLCQEENFEAVENIILYRSPAVFMWMSGLCFGWQVWSNAQPMCIIDFFRVDLLGCAHPASMPALLPFA